MSNPPIPTAVIWLTGLPASGKTTTARELIALLQKNGLQAQLLDGDEIRAKMPNIGFTKEARIEHIKRVGLMASELQKSGIFAVAALVSPYSSAREFVRSVTRNMIEVYMATSLEVCEQRDVKGNYGKARTGEIANFTGVNDPYEAPLNPEITLDAKTKTPNQCGEAILHYLLAKSER